MDELSLNILDISQNSVKAGADKIEITLLDTGDTFSFIIADNGCGMDEETVKNVVNPFYTTRKTRSVGLGLPLLKLACEQTGGYLEIKSTPQRENALSHGTIVKAFFYKNHIDFIPLGDITSSVVTMIQGAPDIHWIYVFKSNEKDIRLDTNEMKEILGDVPLNNIEVLAWIRDYLNE